MAVLKTSDVITRKVAGCGRTEVYKIGCGQISAWKHRWTLPRCKSCGRIIDGEMKRGFCVWCQSMNVAAKIEIAKIETAKRKERLKKERERDHARMAAKRAAWKAVAK